MAQNQKSAKDIAFEKERAKFRQAIREKESETLAAKRESYLLKEENRELKRQIEEQQEWINRLLEYMDMPEDEMRTLLETEKHSAEVREKFNTLFGGMVRGFY